MKSDVHVGLYVYDHLGYEVVSRGYCSNNYGVTLSGMNPGETYKVVVIYRSGFGDYTFNDQPLRLSPQDSGGCLIEIGNCGSAPHPADKNVFRLHIRYTGVQIGQDNQRKAVQYDEKTFINAVIAAAALLACALPCYAAEVSPVTGDITMYVVIALIVAAVAIVGTLIYSKFKK